MTTISLADCQKRVGHNLVQESNLCTLSKEGAGICSVSHSYIFLYLETLIFFGL